MSDKRDRRTAAINLTISYIRGMISRLRHDTPERAEMFRAISRLEEIRGMPDEKEQEKALRGLTERYEGGNL